MDTCNFSLNHYEETLEKIKESHKFSNFFNCSTQDVILRHDVDVSLPHALKIAKLENQINVSSTFFILFHAELYNPFSQNMIEIVKQIYDLGHTIGLHYNSEILLKHNLDPTLIILKEIETMESHYDIPIRVISAHDPGTNKKLSLDLPQRIVDVYSEKFISDRKYISDSVQNWKEGCFCKNFKNYKKLQILTHPIWWTENNSSREFIINSLLSNENNTYHSDVLFLKNKYKEYIAKLTFES